MARRPAKQKVIQFIWEGTDSNGRKVKGDEEGPSATYVRAQLRRQGIRATKVKRKPSPLFQRKKKITTGDLTFATRQLATMISAGIPVAQAIDGIGRGHENPSMQEMLSSIRQDVESGTNLSVAMARYPVHFDLLYRSLVDAGEQSGTLDVLLDKVATYKEKIEALKSKIKSAMLYPTAVLFVAIIVTALLLIFVIPQFESLFQNFGGDLPTLTKSIVELSRWFQAYWWLFFGVLIGAIMGASYVYKRSERLQFAMDRLSLRLPVFGQIFKKSTIARFARTLSTMFGAGVPLVDGLETVANAAGNRVYTQAIMQVRSEVSTGRSLAATLAESGLFPSMVLQMVETGEESGELELMLLKIAEFYEREVDDAVAAMSSLIEPIMIVVLGMTVGTMVVAMYLPIFKMAAVF